MTTRLLLSALIALASAPAWAQVVRARPAAAAPAAPAEAPAEKPEPSCVCSRYNYKPLNAKGVAAKEYWDARGKAKISRGISGITVLFATLAQSGDALNAAQSSYGEAMSALSAAREKAEAVGAVKVVGEDFEEESIEFSLKKGVDYELTGS